MFEPRLHDAVRRRSSYSITAARMSHDWIHVLTPIAIAAVVIFRFARRELVERVVSRRTLWIRPALLLVITAATVESSASTDVRGVARVFEALAVGAALGLATGYGVSLYTTVRASEKPGTVRVRGSYVTFGIWIAAFVARLLARAIVPASTDLHGQFTFICGTLMLVTVAFAVIAVAFYRAIANFGAVKGIARMTAPVGRPVRSEEE